MMDLQHYNKSYEEIIDNFEDEAENRLRQIRQQCVREFIDRLNQRERDWLETFQKILDKSQEEEARKDPPPRKIELPTVDIATLSNNINLQNNVQPIPKAVELLPKNEVPPQSQAIQSEKSSSSDKSIPPKQQVEIVKVDQTTTATKKEPTNPLFSNQATIQEFIRIQQILEQNRQSLNEINTSPALKSLKNELNLFIRTQINAISNSDNEHLNTKIRMLTNLFLGNGVTFQDKFINASKHPMGQLFSLDLAAQTFVTVGIRLVNSVPAIAKSMATVINGIMNNNIPIFKDLVIGHLQEQCPYLIPMYPNLDDFSRVANQEVKYKIACGYSFDSKSQTLESDEKYLIRMRSMTLIYACILIQEHLQLAWTWLAAFLSLEPQPVITATILQAFLQEASKKLSSTYGKQYRKLLSFIKDNYVKMIENVTSKSGDKQSLIKLKNLLSDDSNLIAAPPVGSLFGAIRYT